MRPLIYISLLFLACANVFGQVDSIDLLKESNALIYSDQLDEALVLLSNCDTYDCVKLRANVFYRKGVFAKAKPLLLDLLDKNEKDISIHQLLSKIYESEGNAPKAIKHILYLVQNDETNAYYFRKLGQLYAKADYPDDALQAYQKALDLNPKDIITVMAYAELLFGMDYILKADTIIHNGHYLDSTNINVQLLRSKITYKQKNYKKVASILKNLRGRIDFDDYYKKIYGFSLVKIDSIDRAFYYLNKVLANDPEAESVHYYLGIAHEKKGDNDQASFHYQRALSAGTSKQTGIYFRKIGRLAEEKEDWPTAIKNYKKSYEFNQNPELLFLLALATDNYYKDKTTSVNYYSKYLLSKHENGPWKKYALERKNYLKEIAFLKKK